MRFALWIALLGGCVACPSAPVVAFEPSARGWRLAEVRTASGSELVLEAEPLEIGVRLSREQADVGETVEAEIWLPGASGSHRLEIRPSRSDVRILGPRECVVEEAQVVRVRFVCDAAGRGGILVLVKE